MQIRQREKGVEGRMERERETSCFFFPQCLLQQPNPFSGENFSDREDKAGRGQLPRKATDYRCNLGFRLSLSSPFPPPPSRIPRLPSFLRRKNGRVWKTAIVFARS